MLRARTISERMVALQRDAKIGFHTSSIGVEASIVGAVLAARDEDWIFPDARGWYAALARGLPIATYVHHAFGTERDPAKGHAAPDHAPARAYRVVPPSGVIGAHLPQAVGAAWAAKIKGESVGTLALFGSDVAASGDFHNALNFAGVFGVSTIFVCRAKPGEDIVGRAVAYGLASAQVPNDVGAVFAVVREARERKGATLIEVVGADETALAGEDAETSHELDRAIAEAQAASAPAPATMFDDVYAALPTHLAKQRQSLGENGRG
jgi:TPP-dependent pyruvate/acetoin dehydrogenase alpha subunit